MSEERLFKDLMLDPLQEKAFYNALKTKPFVILAGPSGTGKTKIVETFAELMEQSSAVITLDEGTFEIDTLELDFPITLQGQGVDKTTLKVKNLKVRNPKVKLNSLTLLVENIEGYIPNGDYKFAKTVEDIPEDFVVKANQRVELSDKTYIVKDDIKIEPGGKLIIRNATLKFEKEAGIIGKDCTFIAENSKFIPLEENKGWKNITIGGKIKGYIKSCTFKDGKGRKGEEINQLLGLDLWKDKTHGGGLFVYSSEGDYLISDSTFENCSATSYGGGVFALKNVQIENCKFYKCSASIGGGGVYAKNSTLENCSFENCYAELGGGVFAAKSTIENCTFKNCSSFQGGGVSAWDAKVENCTFENCSASIGGGVYAKNSTLENCSFENCFAFSLGGGVFAQKDLTIKECKFENCSAQKKGGGVYCYGSNPLIGNKFENCKPNNCGGKCIC